MSATRIFRFAPSPNGELHLGHAYSALFTDAVARAVGGRVLLRIEDIDIDRCCKEFEDQIISDLQWLGLKWEPHVRRQSEHFRVYSEAVSRLKYEGLLYPCFATRQEIFEAVAASQLIPYPTDPDGAPLYPGLCKHLSPEEKENRMQAGEPFALRLDMEKALNPIRKKSVARLTYKEFSVDGSVSVKDCAPELWGDVVIARKDVPTSYHLSVVIDDALQGVTHVTRGQDLEASTSVHRLLQVLLNLPEPVYCHHRLITTDSGRKLSKSDRDKSLKSLREGGVTADDIRRMTGLDRIVSIPLEN